MTAPEFYFDEIAANAAELFFSTTLVHSKGEWAGEPFELQPWQARDIVRPLFGWKRADGTRRYRIAFIEVPRKNGKSTLCAGFALYLLTADGEPGAEVYSAAADREQAGIVFEEAKAMVEASPELSSMCDVFKRSITVPDVRAVYRVLSRDAYTKHGLNAHGIIFDELHAQPDRELWDVLLTSRGARRQPLVIAITTAGFDKESLCAEQHDYARKVLDGTIDDPDFFAYIAAADPDDDWQSEETWRKANPGYGVTVKPEYLRAEAKRAAEIASYENTFKRLHLDIWTEQNVRWLQIETWDKGKNPVDESELGGRVCYAGLDLASTTDLAALVLAFPDGEEPETFDILPFFWLPADNVRQKIKTDGVRYDVWIQQGLITATEGNVIDYGAIALKLDELARRFDIKEVAYDRWGATELIQKLQDGGLDVIPFGQGFASMSPATKAFEALLISGRVRHGGHPVLRWMAGNVVVRQDPAGNLKPDKAKSKNKIDGIVAMIMALDRATRKDDQDDEVYNDRGLLVI